VVEGAEQTKVYSQQGCIKKTLGKLTLELHDFGINNKK
jgi:hypothetical protein